MIKVLTLNIWNYKPPWRRRCQQIRQLIEREQPDLVGLQEVCNDWWLQRPWQHQAAQINRGLGYQVVFRPAATYWRFPRVQVGQAVLSRYPVQAVEVLPLSYDPDDPRDRLHPRNVLRAEVETDEGRVNFFVTHLSLSYQARTRTAAELLDFTHRCDPALPQIIVGDFNAIPHQFAVHFLTGQAEMNGKRGDFRDAWAAIHPNDLGYTFRVDQRMRRIDYVFVRGDVCVSDIHIVGDQPDAEGVYPSDHCGLLAALKVSRLVV
jgi:endonuclease/exonuclease/phosphatase family metal-dependent hydrolase